MGNRKPDQTGTWTKWGFCLPCVSKCLELSSLGLLRWLRDSLKDPAPLPFSSAVSSCRFHSYWCGPSCQMAAPVASHPCPQQQEREGKVKHRCPLSLLSFKELPWKPNPTRSIHILVATPLGKRRFLVCFKLGLFLPRTKSRSFSNREEREYWIGNPNEFCAHVVEDGLPSGQNCLHCVLCLCVLVCTAVAMTSSQQWREDPAPHLMS